MPGNRNAIGKWPLNREISYLISHKMFNNKKRLFWCALGVLTKAALYIQMQSAQCVLHYYVCSYHWYVEMPICTLCIAQYLSQSCIDYEYSKSKKFNNKNVRKRFANCVVRTFHETIFLKRLDFLSKKKRSFIQQFQKHIALSHDSLYDINMIHRSF